MTKNKTAITTTLIIFILIVGFISYSFAGQTVSTSVTSSGTIVATPSPSPTPSPTPTPSPSPSPTPTPAPTPTPSPSPSPSKLNNAIVIYGTTTLDTPKIADVAANYSILICDHTMSSTVLQSIRNLNSSILIYGYNNLQSEDYDPDWATVNANEAWFAHDISGNRIWTYTDNHEYLMNTSTTSGYISYLSTYMNSQLTGSQFNGTFIDNVWDNVSGRVTSMRDAVTGDYLTLSDISSTFVSNWHSNVITDLTYIESHVVANKKVMVNTDELTTHTYLNIVDGEMSEGWVYASWIPLDYYETLQVWDSSYPIGSINAMTVAVATGKIFLAESGTTTGDIGQINQAANFCYTSALLGFNNTNCYFGFKAGSAYTYNSAMNYIPTLRPANLSLGSPSGAYYSSQSVYMRNFTNGLVIVNPTNNNRSITLSGYHFINGTNANSFTSAAYNGEVLLKDGA